MKNKMEVPRRSRLDLMHVSEKTIMEAIFQVDKLAPDPSLTEALTLLGKAKDIVSDFIDTAQPIPQSEVGNRQSGEVMEVLREHVQTIREKIDLWHWGEIGNDDLEYHLNLNLLNITHLTSPGKPTQSGEAMEVLRDHLSQLDEAKILQDRAAKFENIDDDVIELEARMELTNAKMRSIVSGHLLLSPTITDNN